MYIAQIYKDLLDKYYYNQGAFKKLISHMQCKYLLDILNYYDKSFIIAEQMTHDAKKNVEEYFC